MCLTIQPQVIQDLAAKSGFRGRGLLARFLYSIPLSLVGFRSNDPPAMPRAVRESWHRSVRDILKIPDPPQGQEQAILLCPDAHELFQEYRDRVEVQLRPGEELHEIQDWGNKLAGTTARLAGILHLLHHAGGLRPWETPLARDTLAAAISLGDYFSAHANVAFGQMGADPRSGKARLLWASILRMEVDHFSQRDLLQRVRRSFPLNEMSEPLEVLVDMGYLRRASEPGTTGRGRPSSPVFEVNPLARTQNPRNTLNSPAEPIFGDSGDLGYAITVPDSGADPDWGEV